MSQLEKLWTDYNEISREMLTIGQVTDDVIERLTLYTEENTCRRGCWFYWILHFLLAKAQRLLGRFSSNLAHVGKFSENDVITFQPMREVTRPTTCFLQGWACPVDNLKNAVPVLIKFGK